METSALVFFSVTIQPLLDKGSYYHVYVHELVIPYSSTSIHTKYLFIFDIGT